MPWRFLGSLRTRLVLLLLLVQCGLLALAYFQLEKILQRARFDAVSQRAENVANVTAAVVAREMIYARHAELGPLLDTLRTPENVDYLVVVDNAGQVLATSGWDAAKPLPPPSRLVPGELPRLLHLSVPVRYGYSPVGELHFGLSTQRGGELLRSVLQQNLWILIASALLSTALFALAAAWVVRQLYRLIDSVEQALSGQTGQATTLTEGEQDRLLVHFRTMLQRIDQRVSALQQSEARFHALADYTHSAELWIDPQGKLLWVNASVERLTGYRVEECLLLDGFPVGLAVPDERERFAEMLRRALQDESSMSDFEFRAVRRDGQTFWAAASWLPLYDGDGKLLGLRASIRDNTELKEDRLALRRALMDLQQLQLLGQGYLQRAEAERARLMALLSAMRFGVLFVDNDNRVVFHNPAFAEQWGLPADADGHGRPLGQVLQQAANQPAISDIAVYYLEELALADERVDFGALTMNDGRIITQYCYRVLDQQGQTNGRMWIYEDVTQQRAMAERMISLAERDALTGLYNRHRFQDELDRLFADAERRGARLALLYFDLDEFKFVNDTFGHGVGDELLVVIAQEIGRQVRRNEILARLGGDEFAVLLPDGDEAAAARLAERIIATISQITFSARGHTLRPASSLGVAIYPQHAGTSAELVAHADAAMYQAKSAGKSTWRLYRADADPSQNALARLSWKERITQALENDGFELHFQGIYEAATRKLVHLEALLRMKDAQNPGELIMPGSFIPHAEKTGKIIDLDRWVIRKAISILAERPAAPSIAVNVSGRSFDEPGLPEFIADELKRRRVDPRRLLVELTETAAVSDLRDAQRFIDALRATGCRVCLDDFGVGFASFAYLKQLKADVLKIDGMFIRDLPRDRDSQIFVRGMVQMAHDMGKITVAEFVENVEILEMLLEFGIDQVQGYHLDRPQRDHPGLNA
ncbi:EAL domain-containing protein [Chitinilyticum litopenaei]|uniref:EAL domain-containing protein n=1 Tax=Chitinilyticum litopenaei TaxID=1121276 RepID=UPI0003F749B2|nr:EAL domain-containing protein [Chitinilyticum litopenaei]